MHARRASTAWRVALWLCSTACAAGLASAGCDAGDELVPPPGLAAKTVGEIVATSQTGEVVKIERAIVLAHDSYDEVNTNGIGTLYFADASNEMGHAMQAFAPQVQIRSGDFLQPGDVIDLMGSFVRFLGPPPCAPPEVSTSCFDGGRSVAQLGQGAVVHRVGFWQSPTPLEVDPPLYAAHPERYQGSLITVRNQEVTTRYALVFSASGRPRIDPAQLASGIRIGADLYKIPGITRGTRIRRLTGIASYFYNDFILPRSAADVELEEGTAVAEEAALCSDGMDNDLDGAPDCEDTDCCGEARCKTLVVSEVLPNPTGDDAGHEWIELFNPAGYGVALGCTSLGRGGAAGWSGLAPTGGRVAARGCVVVGAGAPHVDVMTTFNPELANGGAPGVGVGVFAGSTGAILPTTTPLDAIIYGDDNASHLSNGHEVLDRPDAPTPAEGSSIERTSIAARTFTVNATPTPGDCSRL